MEGDSIIRGLSGRILKANLTTVALFGVLWLGIILYFKRETDRADHIRLSADRMNIELLECRRAEKDFIARDLTNPTFHEATLSGAGVGVPGTNLEKWERRAGALKEEVEHLKALVGNDVEFDPKSVRQIVPLTEEYLSKFRSVAAALHQLGFKDWGIEGGWRKAAHELEASFRGLSDHDLLLLLLELRRDEKDYLLRHETPLLGQVKQDLGALRDKLKALPAHAALSEKLDAYERGFDSYVALRSKIGASVEEGLLGDMRTAAHSLDSVGQELMDQSVGVHEKTQSRFWWMLGSGGILGLLLAGVMGALLGRRVASPISELAATCQSAAAELQAAANQQATGTKEHAASMNEISTTINELLASSRQIAESARRVAQIAEHAGTAARGGDQTVHRSQELIGGIRKQVDLIVTHMLDLGKKSQQIGGVLEIINELAEQTNILAINATIEAAGGGESGRRFGVVADEIRKLADRVSGSTKEIRSLVEEVRGAVNATVMTTETGSKAVDAGATQFGEVASAFKQIVGLVATNTEAGREIELTTKQQATAVEQVNAGVQSVGQATREMEASTAQTFQTATQLTSVARQLSKLVNASTNGVA